MSTASMNNLPNELLEIIFAKLAIRDVFRTETTCKKWKTLIWSSQTDIIFPPYNTQHQKGKAVNTAIHKILTAADPVKIRKLDISMITYTLNEQNIAALKKMKSLNFLSIDFSAMTQERCSFIPYLTNLQHLSLRPSQEGIDSVGSAHLPHLTSLTMLFTPISNLSPLLNLTRVKELDLRHCQLSDKTGVIALFTSMAQIDTLNIVHVRGIESDEAFGGLSCLTNLTDLSISGGPLPSMVNNWNGKSTLNKVLSALSTLKSLDMKYLRDYNSETIKIISDMPDLTKLVINLNNTPSEPLSKLTNMQHLILSTSTEERKSDKFYSVMTNLTSLKISMSDSDFSHFEHLTRLKYLIINNTYQIDDSFYPYLQKMTQLEHLDFRLSKFSVMQLGNLSSLQFLTHLDVKDILCLNAVDVINSLTQLTNLRSLHVPCGFRLDWLLALPNLDQLYLSFPRNIAPDEETVTLLTPLLGMTKLFRLSVADLPCSPEKVRDLFRNHRNLTSLCVNFKFI